VLVDPGPPDDLDVVTRKVEAVIGSLDRVDYIFLNHHDPDVAANAPAIQQKSRTTQVICSEDTFRHARHFHGEKGGLDPKRFMAVESFPGGMCTLPTGHTLQFVPTPFCHNRGAVMLFDPNSRVLFSGDLFGGARAPVLVASEIGWPGIEMFHQIYMPSQRALGLAAGRVQRLSPSPQLIAPQHGALIVGNDVARFVDRVGRLEVGLDLPENPANLERYLAAANAIAAAYEEIAGVEGSRELKAGFAGDGSCSRLFTLDGRRAIASFKVAPRLALEAFAVDAVASVPEHQRADFRRAIDGVLRSYEVNLPTEPGLA
jgi:glyoxylase-like metal-dependent hydrolase (beta-lactamase superfamily II)